MPHSTGAPPSPSNRATGRCRRGRVGGGWRPSVGAPARRGCPQARGLVRPLLDYIAGGRPYLGVCLGLQLLLDATDEGDADCLGLAPGPGASAARRPQGAAHGLEHRCGSSARIRCGMASPKIATSTSCIATTPTRRSGSRGSGPHRLRRRVLQHLRPRQRSSYAVPPGKERRQRPADLRQLRQAGRRGVRRRQWEVTTSWQHRKATTIAFSKSPRPGSAWWIRPAGPSLNG